LGIGQRADVDRSHLILLYQATETEIVRVPKENFKKIAVIRIQRHNKPAR
jgi:hypothetical protein